MRSNLWFSHLKSKDKSIDLKKKSRWMTQTHTKYKYKLSIMIAKNTPTCRWTRISLNKIICVNFLPIQKQKMPPNLNSMRRSHEKWRNTQKLNTCQSRVLVTELRQNGKRTRKLACNMDRTLTMEGTLFLSLSNNSENSQTTQEQSHRLSSWENINASRKYFMCLPLHSRKKPIQTARKQIWNYSPH